MKKHLLSALAASLLTVGLHAQTIAFQQFTLSNGLQVILHEDHNTPLVAVSVMYHVGSKNEKANRSGFAHFFEHLLFEGTENIQRGEFDDYISNAGGINNANTTQDRTFYYEVLPSNQLALGLWLESERMLHAIVDPVGIETQRKVVKEERKVRYDNRPYGRLLEECMKRCFKKHPYGHTPIGSLEDIDAANILDFQQFYRDFYRPDNAILSIAGDINPDQTKQLIEVYFKDIPKGEGPVFRPNELEPPLAQEVRDTFYDNIQLPAVALCYRIPAQGTPDYYAVKMLGMLLSQGESSRMITQLVDQQQKAVDAGSFPLDLEDPGVFIFYGIGALQVAPSDLEQAIDVIIQDVQSKLVTEKEFQRVQNQIENDLIAQKDKMIGVAGALATYSMFFGDPGLINTEIERYRKVTRDDLRRVAKTYFDKQKRVCLYYLPAKRP
ncbi:MAG: insulinase family protein [Bacteroidetes bacterium]|nr:insulinase family protein [Bacteroidota bacterium]